MNSDQWCKHYHGLGGDEERCPVGVLFGSIQDRRDGKFRWACCYPGDVHCDKYEPESPEVLAERREALQQFNLQMDALVHHETDVCPRCGKSVKRIERVGRCLYARPCGCRLYQADKIPDNWRRVNSNG